VWDDERLLVAQRAEPGGGGHQTEIDREKSTEKTKDKEKREAVRPPSSLCGGT